MPWTKNLWLQKLKNFNVPAYQETKGSAGSFVNFFLLQNFENVSTSMPEVVKSRRWTSWQSSCGPLAWARPLQSWGPTWSRRMVECHLQIFWRSCTPIAPKRASQKNSWTHFEARTLEKRGSSLPKICGIFWQSGEKSWAPKKVMREHYWTHFKKRHLYSLTAISFVYSGPNLSRS